ncbi:DUF1122 family protein [Thermococcus alcaliphilus]|uniref:DUF1122 family protein n=1 Tax=Thermococcus alcaliphilus TaxID=139207 RepID=UPI0020915CFD|nr:DUF1122 family protein [Thermococcus alcaliphilus]MCO6042124.1 DUF1122 family protein [Thermococcus alcaliphilus]
MIENAVEELLSGIKVGEFEIYAEKYPGRFPNEALLEIFIEKGSLRDHLLYARIYFGRRYYSSWVEVSSINPTPNVGLLYFNSPVEETLLELFASHLKPGEHIFVSYVEDLETKRALYFGAPAPTTRLGFKLFNLGFTWFKDWYFPEGFKEGGEKLQAEKPLNEEQRRVHLLNIRKELEEFLERGEIRDKYLLGALKRGQMLLNSLNELI